MRAMRFARGNIPALAYAGATGHEFDSHTGSGWAGILWAMITHLQGTLARMDPSGPVVEVDVSGVRYEVLVPLFLWQELQALADGAVAGEGGEPASVAVGLHIHYSASANQPVPVLVGFMRRAERDFFRKFTTVEGIGPAKAVKAMNVSVSTIARAIEQEDRSILTRLPGIGARGADKIIATLRGKVVAEAAMHDSGIERPIDPRQTEPRRAAADAAESLVSLGYSRSEAKHWVGEALGADPDLSSVEEITLAVLRRQDRQ